MSLSPINQTNLFSLDNYLLEFVELYKKKRLPTKILLSGDKGLGKSTLAFHLVNYILSINEEHPYIIKESKINPENKSYKLIRNNSHPNIFSIDLIDEKKNIEISQVREMISYANKSSFNDKPRFVLIDNVENLNKNSLNALLKIVEEPNEKLFFLLIQDSGKKILDTLKSRCIIFKLNLSFEKSIYISNEILGENVLDFLNEELLNYYITPGEIINLINFSKNNNIDLKKNTLRELLLILINENYYNKDKFIKVYIFNIIQKYFLNQLNTNKDRENTLLMYQKFINMNYNCNKFNLNYENFFLEFKTKVLNE